VTFGQYLRQLRKAKGLSQRELAKKIGIDYTYLSKIEADKRPPPSEKTILALAHVLNADMDELFGLAKKIPSSLFKRVDPEKVKILRSILDEENTPLNEQEVLIQNIGQPEAPEIERTRPEQVLTQEAERFRVVIENSVDGILIMNSDLDIIYETPSAARIIGYEPGELAGRMALSIVHEDDASMLAHEFNQLLHDPERTGRAAARVRHKDGTWRVVEAVAINLLHDPAVKGIIINYRDITDSRQYEVAQVRYAVNLTIEEEYRLTDTEKEVLTMMVEGQTNSQIAGRLVISTSTIKFHVGNILRKLGATNRTEAVALALRRYLVTKPSENPPSV
jgi:PAS domain S-box-containing protein